MVTEDAMLRDWGERGGLQDELLNGENLRSGPALRGRMAAWLRWILGWITPPISPRLLA